MSLSVCLLPDATAERAIRALWTRLEQAGIATLKTHTHGRHVPHLTVASLLAFDQDRVREVVDALGRTEPTRLHFDALGMFPRSRCWLAPAAVDGLPARQDRLAAALVDTGAVLHRSYRPGVWVPHLTLAPRLHLADLPMVARHAFEVLPLTATMDRAALVETRTGARVELPYAL